LVYGGFVKSGGMICSKSAVGVLLDATLGEGFEAYCIAAIPHASSPKIRCVALNEGPTTFPVAAVAPPPSKNLAVENDQQRGRVYRDRPPGGNANYAPAQRSN
jgi:hypothetical protein